ncbi:MAG: hypothetical protein U5K79_12265 [Cyclobacteriaceae bacterium]|nr:hypothetical protein [Cyclobacteriaceae bacterium]
MKTLSNLLLIASFGILIAGCNSKNATENQSAIEQPPTPTLIEVWATDTLLKTPESVIYDQANGVIYVSNVNQNPWEKDENGFISKISKTGEILTLEWVTGFSGPKGMGINGDTLFVADLDELVLVSISSGAVIEKIKIDGASGLNDITVANGVVYISDSNAGKIFQYSNGEVTVFHADVPGRPNGLLTCKWKAFSGVFRDITIYKYRSCFT